MDIKGLPPLDEIQGIVFCALLEPSLEGPQIYVVDMAEFTMRHKGIDIIGRVLREFKYLESKNVWHEYFDREYFELKGDSLQFELFTHRPLVFRSVGVHIKHKHAENAKDHPDVTHVDFHFSIDESNRRRTYFLESSSAQDEPDEEIKNSVGSIEENEVDEETEISECLTREDERNKIERFQPSKRRCDDDDYNGDHYNLESSCFSVRTPYLTLMLVNFVIG
jgi:hypothetical protein